MRETALALSLVELACAELSHFGQGARVTDLRIRLGRRSGIATETLLFAFTLAAEGTPVAGATLDIDDARFEERCPQCDAFLLPGRLSHVCPACGASAPPTESDELQLVALGVAGPVARVSAGH
jgi:hydrogenase nickel incorporation protein HypA/HybF